MKKIDILLPLFVMLNSVSMGQQVSRNDAKNLAAEVQSWLHPNEVVTDSLIYEYKKNSRTLMYEVLMSNKEAILISGNYKCKPILATIGNTGKSLLSNRDSLPCGLGFMLDWYEEQIERAFSDAGDNATWQEWRGRAVPQTRISGVEPLTTSRWGQESPYNSQIPQPFSGNCDHALVGCVALAMGQLMYYYKNPGVSAYPIQQFDWCNMKDSINNNSSEIEIDAISYFLAECAARVTVLYGCDATTSFLNIAQNALTEDFQYHNQMALEFQDNHSDEWWKNTIIGQLDRGNPVLYGGATDFWGENGHAFICDGYNEFGKFHFNWGWGGDYDSVYCELTYIYNEHPDTPYTRWLCAIFYAYPESYFDLCDGILYLDDFYSTNYQGSNQAYNNIRPYVLLPKSKATLVSASNTSDPAWRTIPSEAQSKYQAHEEIIFRDGFTVERGADFIAEIIPCPACETRENIPDAENDGLTIEDMDDSNVHEANQAPYLQHIKGQISKIQPNPTEGELTVAVDGEVAAVVILDVNGNPQGGWDFDAITDEWVTLNVRRLKAGPYLLLVRHTDGRTESTKFIKQ